MAAGLCLLAMIGVFRHFTDTAYAISVFLIAPIALVTWFSGPIRGFACVGLTAVMLLATDLPHAGDFAHPDVPLVNVFLRTILFTGTVFVIARLHRALDSESLSARTDSLTGLTNRRGFSEAVQREIAHARRFSEPLSVVYLDVDRFKRINDRRGHTGGDTVLQTIARTVRREMREIDVLGRLGGDEFAILLPRTGEVEALGVAHRLQHILRTGEIAKGLELTFSIGAITCEAACPETDADTLVREADRMMYEAKRGGGNSIRSGAVRAGENPVPRAD
jgi:diguanylate cyclase (GGDEF)-like protein